MNRIVKNSVRATEIATGNEIMWLTEVVKILNKDDSNNVLRRIFIFLLDQPLNRFGLNGQPVYEATMSEIAEAIGVQPSQVSQNVAVATRRMVPIFKTRRAHPLVFVSIDPAYMEMLLNFRPSRLRGQ